MPLSPFFHFSRFRGINNVDDPMRVYGLDQQEDPGSSSFVAATDVEIDVTRMVSQRLGYTSRAAGDIHSLWSEGSMCFFVKGTELKRLYIDYSESIIQSGLNAGLKMSYATVNELTVVSNGQIIGYIEGGIYNEFATPTKNGKVVPTPGHLVEIFKGRLLVAQGSMIAYSDTLALNQFDYRKNFVQLPGFITMMKAVKNGVWLSDGEKTYFAKGLDFDKVEDLDEVSTHGVIPGTAQNVDKEIWWMSDEGFCRGGENGGYEIVTEDRYVLSEYRDFGASLYRTDKKQLIVSLHN